MAETASDGGAETADPPTENSEMLAEVRQGLTASPRWLSPKYFYDRRGSELFERITRLPEYYLTRAELEILRGPVREWIRDFAPAALVELGAGSARKTRVLLEAMLRAREGALYVPLDVSADFLAESARALRSEYPTLTVEPEVGDFSADLELEAEVDRPALFALLGSTIGNFPASEAPDLLARIRGWMDPGDAFLMGADLRPGPGKSLSRLEEAYDDAEGVTARFNRNILRVLNRRLGTDFDPEAFAHRAFYDREEHRIEMHLLARRGQRVRLPDGTDVEIDAGESVRTEISCKYDRAAVADLFRDAGLGLEEWFLDDEERYALAVGRPAGREREETDG